MATAVDRILHQRAAAFARRRPQSVAVSVLAHALVVASAVLVPRLFVKEVPKLEAIAVTVVPPRALGEESPTPPRREKAPKPVEQPPTPPAPEPKPPEKKEIPPPPTPTEEPAEKPAVALEPKKNDKRPVAPPEPAAPSKAEPEPKPPAPAPAASTETTPGADIAKRQGSPFGNPLGSSNLATLGVEDPNFTYGYYLDRVVGLIFQNWTRPPVGAEVKQAVFYFRIDRGGVIRDLKLVEPSGSEAFDQAALRAIEASSPLPPLPKGYNKEILGLHMIVK
jgi:TonB family protein